MNDNILMSTFALSTICDAKMLIEYPKKAMQSDEEKNLMCFQYVIMCLQKLIT